MIYGKYKEARNTAWQALVDFSVKSLPVPIASIANTAGITLVKSTDLPLRIAGITTQTDNAWTIIYKADLPRGARRFTIAHELGHIFLGHPMNGNYTRTFDLSKPSVESEADIFASRFLMPACVLHELQAFTPERIKEICDVSMQAAKVRSERIALLERRGAWYKSPLETQVKYQFWDWIIDNKKSPTGGNQQRIK